MWRGSYHVPGTSGLDDAEDPMVEEACAESTGRRPLLDMTAGEKAVVVSTQFTTGYSCIPCRQSPKFLQPVYRDLDRTISGL
jgi:hypothetical protein